MFPAGQTPADFAANVRAKAEQRGRARGSVERIALPSGVTLLYERRPGASVDSYTVAIRAGRRHGDSAGLAEAVANRQDLQPSRAAGRAARAELERLAAAFSLDLGDPDLMNLTEMVERGVRVAQMVIVPVPRVEWDEVEELPETERGAGGFGSSGV